MAYLCISKFIAIMKYREICRAGAIALFVLFCSSAANAQIADTLHELSYPVEQGRELPRTGLLSYNSEARALAGDYAPSLYLQPLSGEWQREQRDGYTVFSYAFKIPFDWVDREQFAHIDRIGGAYYVAVNGKTVAYNQNGATAAEFDITKYTTEGMNRLEVMVCDNSAADALDSGDKQGKATIAGRNYITSQPRVRIRDFVTHTVFVGDDANLELGIIVKSHLLNTKSVNVYYTLLSPSGEVAASGNRTAEFSMRGEDTVRFLSTVKNVAAWNHEAPDRLYTLQMKIQHEGRYTEYMAKKIGLTTVEVRGGKLCINGYEAPLSVAEYGGAADSVAARAVLLDLKSGGVNMLRLNRPQPEYFYDLCDEIGLYVCNQAAIDTHLSGDDITRGGNPSNDPQWAQAYTDRAMTMYYTSRNHPCVVMFSLAGNSAQGYNLYESYLAMKRVEHAKPVVYMWADGQWNSDAVTRSLAQSDKTAAADRMVFDTLRDSNGQASVSPILKEVESGVYEVSNPSYLTTFKGYLSYSTKRNPVSKLPFVVRPQESVTLRIPADPKSNKQRVKYNVELTAD
jgi:beta-galactosidase